LLPNINHDELQELAYQAQLELSRRSFHDYVVQVHRGHYQHFRHTELICNELQPIADGEQRYILLELPPRHGKSMTVTESFPSYYLLRNPDKRVITTSYSDTLARKFGRLNRNKLAEYGPELFDVELSDENSATDNWGIKGRNGGMISVSIGGSITGQGADLMIIDDPFKNSQDANSITIRNKVWDEWEATLSTRLHKGASVIVIMTRWHEDDIIGRLLERSPYDWKRIRLPAIAEDEDDLLNREIGDPLCPELGYDEEWAENKKIEVGSRTWAALYQQRPSPASGNIFNRKWWQYYKTMPDLSNFDEIVGSWDCTFKDNNDSDYVVGQVWGRIGANKYLLDQVRDRMDFTATKRAIEAQYAKWPYMQAIYIEDKANGSAVIQTLQNDIPGIIPVNPQGGKIARASAISPQVEAKNVYLPKDAEWVSDFVEEATAFPNGKHDDSVDSMTQALAKMNEPVEYERVAMPYFGGVK
jgi:predicted phage terminase large subunit-like protein